MTRRYPPKLEPTHVADAPDRLGTGYRAHNGVRSDPGYATAEVNVVREAQNDRLRLQIYSATPGTEVRLGTGPDAITVYFGSRSASGQTVAVVGVPGERQPVPPPRPEWPTCQDASGCDSPVVYGRTLCRLHAHYLDAARRSAGL